MGQVVLEKSISTHSKYQRRWCAPPLPLPGPRPVVWGLPVLLELLSRAGSQESVQLQGCASPLQGPAAAVKSLPDAWVIALRIELKIR